MFIPYFVVNSPASPPLKINP